MLQRLTENVRGVECLAWSPRDGVQGAAVPENVGDRFGPIVLDQLAAALREPLDPRAHRRVLSVGSVLHFAELGDIVWGSGVNGKMTPAALPAWLDVRAVRGPYTRAALLACGIPAPEIYGDPALLLPNIRPEILDLTRNKKRDVLVVPNLNELDRFSHIDIREPFGDPWEFVKDIAESEFVTGTSLHALIIADALGVPARPIAPSAEHPFKYVDHYAGTGRPDVRFASDVDDAVRLGGTGAPRFDADELIAAFPSDAWLGTRPPVGGAGSRVTETLAAYDAAIADLRRHEADAASRAALDIVTTHAKIGPSRDGLTREEIAALGLVPRPVQVTPTTDDETPPTLSVVMPTHDVAPWIVETLGSVLAQDLPGLEVIVVDDHSTDGTRQHVARIAATDPRVRVVDSLSRGGGTARNIGIDHARGHLLAFADADDIVPPGAYRSMVESIDSSGSDIVFGDFLKFSPISTWSPTSSWTAHRSPMTAVELREHPTLVYGRACWNKVFRRASWDAADIRFPDVPRSNDILPMTTAYLAARTVDVVDDIVYLYRERPGASSMTARAGSATSLLSYLDQELECARLIDHDGSEPLRRQYASLILDRDGWVHLTRFLRSPQRDRSRDSEILDRFRELVGSLARTPERLKLPLRRLVWRLSLEGSVDAAAALCRALIGPEPSVADELAAWAEILRLDTAAGFDVLESRWRLRGGAMNALTRAIVQGDERTDDAAIQIAREIGARDPRVIASIPEFSDPLASDGELRRRFAMTRRLGARVIQVDTGRRIRAQVSVEAGEAIEAVLYDEHHGRAVRTTGKLTAATIAEVGRSRLRHGHKHRVAVYDASSGSVHSALGRPLTPEYDPFDAFLLAVDQRGVALTPRRHWIIRGTQNLARRAYRELRLRVRPNGG